jgi:hypothetical protein
LVTDFVAAARLVVDLVVRAGRLAACFLAGAGRRVVDFLAGAGRRAAVFFFRDADGGVTWPALFRRAAAALA